MAKKRVRGRGRTVVALVLLGFVLVAASVIQRRVYGRVQGQEIRRLQDSMQALEARRTKLLSEIEEAQSLSVIGKVAGERLGMRPSSETPTVFLPQSQK